MELEQKRGKTEMEAESGRKGGEANDQEPGGHAFGKSWTTNSGLAESTGVARKDTPDANTQGEAITGGPETGTSTTARP